MATTEPATPESIVQTQLDAYNAHDTERFAACFAEDVRMAMWPSDTVHVQGRQALAAFYRLHRFNRPELRAELIQRVVFGNTVIDHEVIRGLEHHSIETVAMYRIENGLIASTHFVERQPAAGQAAADYDGN